MQFNVESNPNDFTAIIVGDIHYTGKIPECRLDKFTETLDNKINEVIELGNHIKADTTLLSGDLLDSADASKSVIRRLGRMFLKSDNPIYFINGNHDLHGGNPLSFERVGTGIIDGFNAATLIHDNEKIYIEKDNLKIQLSGTSYKYNIDRENIEESYCVKKEEGSTHSIHMVHGYLSPITLMHSHTLISSIKDKTEADVTVGGHLHTSFLQCHNNKYFVNAGAIGRDTACMADFNRMPMVYILRITQEGVISFEPYYLQCARPSEEVIDRTHIVDERIYEEKMDIFMSKLEDTKNFEPLDLEEIVSSIASNENLDEEIVTETFNYISIAKNVLAEEERNRPKGLKNLDSMTLKNYQSHADTTIQFHKNITTIIGETDQGKTSIFRNFRYVLENKPEGTKFIKKGTKLSENKITFVDSSSIERIRSKSINRVIVSDSNNTPYEENDFGRDYSPIVKESIGYKPIVLDDDNSINVNYSAQFDGPFLISEKPFVRAKLIDSIARINVITNALDSVNQETNKIKLENSRIETEINKIEENLKNYDTLEQEKQNLEQLSLLIDKLKEINTKKNTLNQLKDSYSRVFDEKTKTLSQINNLSTIRKADMVVSNLKLLKFKEEQVLSLKTSMITLKSSKEYCVNTLKYKEKIEKSEEILNNMLCINSLSKELINLKNNHSNIQMQKQNLIQTMDKFKLVISGEVTINKLLNIEQEKLKLMAKKEEIVNLTQQKDNISKEITKYKNVISRLITVGSAETKLKELSIVIDKKNTALSLKENLSTCRVSINDINGLVIKETNELNNCKQKYVDLLKNIQVCPLCFNNIDENHVHTISKNL